MPVKKKAKKKRRYDLEYARYHSKPAQKKRRAARNKARRKMVKAGKAKKGDGKDVHHKNSKSMSSSASNLAVVSRKKNRGFKRSKTGKNLGLRRTTKKKTTRKR